MTDPALILDGVVRSFPDGAGVRRVLDGVDLEVRPGELLALVGPSGSGKTTLLRVASGLMRVDHGSVSLMGNEITDLSPSASAALRRKYLGLLLQGYGLLEDASILENVTLPLRFGADRPRRRERKRRGLSALRSARLDLDPRGRVSRLSAGERQRVAIARALITEPSILLADEPTASLDAETGAHIVELLKDLAGRGVAVVVATHDPAVSRACDAELRLSRARVEGGPVR